MQLPPSQVKKLFTRLGQWKKKASEKSYRLREEKKENKRLKTVIANTKNSKNDMKVDFLKQMDTIEVQSKAIKQADDEKIKQLETKVQQLELEAQQADELKKTIA